MSDLIKKLKSDKVNAFKEKDSITNGIATLLLSSLLSKEKELKRELSEEEEVRIIEKELKQTQESLSLVPEDRMDLITEYSEKIKYLLALLPERLSLDEVVEQVTKYLTKNKLDLNKENRGSIFKGVMDTLSGKTDGKTINSVITELLGKFK